MAELDPGTWAPGFPLFPGAAAGREGIFEGFGDWISGRRAVRVVYLWRIFGNDFSFLFLVVFS